MQSTHKHIRKETLWVLSNLTAGPTEHAAAVVDAGAIPLMVSMLSSTFDIKKEVCSDKLQRLGQVSLRGFLSIDF